MILTRGDLRAQYGSSTEKGYQLVSVYGIWSAAEPS